LICWCKHIWSCANPIERPEPELKTKSERLNEVNIALNLDKRENEIVEGDPTRATVRMRRNGKTRGRSDNNCYKYGTITTQCPLTNSIIYVTIQPAYKGV
jgi:hypothetical protein